ncbi:hypothetical protein UL81_09385 [Corynebacterium camporealensis]|uniref:Uncharacterized protein n=2 Tax=Corynebacterium camporealensis TaxID=161896 RepID=A0A0F6TBV2_9CORY|nr:hypothetical protein UL81_09385 [Corynebacterium camporealensis]
MPEEFLSLADWSEQQGYVVSSGGYIADPAIHETADIRLHGGHRPDWPAGYLKDPSRLFAVGNTGGDGSEFCLWLDDNGVQHVVHHGSGSGSILWATFPSPGCVLRLFAVGYFTPAFNEEWAAAPLDPWAGEYEEGEATFNQVVDAGLAPYRAWLHDRWGEPTPATGIEALRLSPAEAELWTLDGPADDPFYRWLSE